MSRAEKKAIPSLLKEFTKLGVKKDGEYIQLNTNVLQIEMNSMHLFVLSV